MARIREALRQVHGVRPAHAATVPPPRLHQAEGEPLLVPLDEGEVPFIEVGGRQTPVEGSPSVLAVPARTEARDEAAPPQPVPVTVFPGVSFRPWPPRGDFQPSVRERFAPELVALHQPEHPVSEQYREVVRSLEAQFPAGPPQVLLFAGITAQTETTPVVLNLAITWARLRKARVAVVDANLRRPSVAQRLGLPAAPGLRDVLAGTASLQRCLQETGQPNLLALVAGMMQEDDARLLAGPALLAVWHHLRARCSWVLVDAPCWDGRPDVVALGAACDAVYLVAANNETDSARTEELSQVLARQERGVRGCICTAS